MMKILLFLVVTHLLFTTQTTIDEDIELGHFKFAINLNKELYNTGSKYDLFSPVNIHAAIALVLYSSNGQTKEQLLNLLGVSSSNNWNELHTNLANRFTSVQNNQEANTTIANGIFVNDRFTVKEPYRKFVQDVYKSKIINVDFGKPEDTLNLMNSWVSDHTGGRIKKISETPYTADTILVLASALYFHANWQNKFKSYLTYNGEFHTNNGNIKVEYMSETKNVQYYEDPSKKFRAIGIPYKANEFSIYYLLPEEGETLQSLISNLNADHLLKITNAGKINVSYKIPKMKLKFETNLREQLSSLGASDLFSDVADLSKLAEGLRVSKVTHVVELEVNEEGTIGSALTTIQIVYTAAFPSEPQKEFNVDKPFLFFIRHKNTNFLIFYGTVNNPAN